VFGFVKVGYRGLAKNACRLFVACALANLFMVRRRLLRKHDKTTTSLTEPQGRCQARRM
jgi:hypothetical protein